MLYLLESIKHAGCDCYDSFVVSAHSMEQARNFAASAAGDEGSHTWKNPNLSTCRILTAENTELGIVLGSFNAGQ